MMARCRVCLCSFICSVWLRLRRLKGWWERRTALPSIWAISLERVLVFDKKVVVYNRIIFPRCVCVCVCIFPCYLSKCVWNREWQRIVFIGALGKFQAAVRSKLVAGSFNVSHVFLLLLCFFSYLTISVLTPSPSSSHLDTFMLILSFSLSMITCVIVYISQQWYLSLCCDGSSLSQLCSVSYCWPCDSFSLSSSSPTLVRSNTSQHLHYSSFVW